jgi:hypothetical protein
MRRGLSCRRACRLLSVARSSLAYESTKEVADAPVRERMRLLAAQYPRYGYRRIRIFLGREGHHMSTERAHRLWRTANLQVPRRRPRRRVATSRPRPLPPTARNHVWAYDFVFDACANGQQLKCLTVVDVWTREALAIDVAGRPRSTRPTSTRGGRGRMAPTRASTASSATSASAWSGSAPGPRPQRSSRTGEGTSTRSGRTRAWPTSRRTSSSSSRTSQQPTTWEGPSSSFPWSEKRLAGQMVAAWAGFGWAARPKGEATFYFPSQTFKASRVASASAGSQLSWRCAASSRSAACMSPAWAFANARTRRGRGQ